MTQHNDGLPTLAARCPEPGARRSLYTSIAASLLCAALTACGGGDAGDATTDATGPVSTDPLSTGPTSTAGPGPGTDTGDDITGTTAASGASTTESGSDTTAVPTTGPGDPTTTATSTTGPDTATGSDSSGDGSTSSTGGVAEGCQRVDFLFVIDSSISMEPEQTALKAAFPAFISTIQNTVSAQDYHIMVVDTDAAGRCTEAECDKGDMKHPTCNNHACNANFSECDVTLGGGVLHPAGQASSNKLCKKPDDGRYLTSEDPTLSDSFACVATVGLAGSGSERPLDAIVAALSPELNAPDACNEGFLRDDAILVITMITDDPNMPDMATPQETYDAVVAAKGGDLNRTVVLGLLPDPKNGCLPDQPDAGAHWAEFIGLFAERGVRGPVCAADYDAFFQDAVAIIDQTCEINPG